VAFATQGTEILMERTMWTHSILPRSPLVAIFWTTYIPFVVPILSLIWRSGFELHEARKRLLRRSKLAGAAAHRQA
jgi:hypothetical protein